MNFDDNNKIDVLAVKVDAISKQRLLDNLTEVLKSPVKECLLITTAYSEFIVTAQKDKGFRDILNDASFNLADGIGILWAASYLNSAKGFWRSAWQTAFNQEKIKDVIPEKISGADIVWDICTLAEKLGQSVYFLGGYGDVTQPIKEKFSALKIAGRYEGSPEERGIIERVNASNADILFVAFGPVKQEYWIWNNKNELKVKLAVGLGGTFDYILGKKSRAGRFWQSHGLEWLYRLLTQPWRAKRMWNAVVVFSWLVFKEKSKVK